MKNLKFYSAAIILSGMIILNKNNVYGAVPCEAPKDNAWCNKNTTISSKENEVDLERSTGFKIIKKFENISIILYKNKLYKISNNDYTNNKPVVTPTPMLENKAFNVYNGMLVNYTHPILSNGEPDNLVYMKDYIKKYMTYADDCMIQKMVVDPLNNMITDMYNNEIKWIDVTDEGAYRSFSLQDGFWKKRIKADPTYGDNPYINGTKCVPATSSEHRTGLALDIRTTDYGYTWLNENCYKYGFIKRYDGDKTRYTGVMDEFWHYTYVGEEIARKCYENDLCLEEYYLSLLHKKPKLFKKVILK